MSSGTLNFGIWIPVKEAPDRAPDAPGLLQARTDEVLTYPRGKSAMVLYARCREGETLRRYVTGRGAAPLGRAAEAGARLVRFAASPTPEEDYGRLLARFVERFGAQPLENQKHDQNDDDERFAPHG